MRGPCPTGQIQRRKRRRKEELVGRTDPGTGLAITDLGNKPGTDWGTHMGTDQRTIQELTQGLTWELI